MQTIFIQCSPDELKAMIVEAIKEVSLSISPAQELKPENRNLLTRRETANHLGISLPTLNEWTKTGKIKAHRISSRVRYFEVDILESLQAMGHVKSAHSK
jgi:excisionase family DNA binding protein